MTTLQLKIFKPTEYDGALSCGTDRGEIRVGRIQLSSYSIISCLEKGVSSQEGDRLIGSENLLLHIDWLDPGVCAGTVTNVYSASGLIIRHQNHFNHMLALHSRGMGQLESTGGLEMAVKDGIIPASFSVKLYTFTGETVFTPAGHKRTISTHGETGNSFQYRLVEASDQKMYDINLNFTFIS